MRTTAAILAGLLIAGTAVAPRAGNGGSSPWGEPGIPANQTRGEKAKNGGTPRIWQNDSELASDDSATFLGGSGHEWLYDGRCFVRGRDRLVCVDLRK